MIVTSTRAEIRRMTRSDRASLPPMKLRSLAIGLSLLTAGTVIGVSSQQFASAEISTGDRPVLVPIEPCRLVDTRPAALVGPRAVPLGTAETLTVDAQQPATPCSGQIPAEALSLSLNVTAIGATETTFLTIWAGGDRPLSSSLNPAPGSPPTPNAVTVDLAADQTFQIYNNLGDVGLLVDVNGYYEHHNHDDRYYTESEIDATFYTQDQADAAFATPADLPELMYATVNSSNPGAISRSTPGVTLTNSTEGYYFLTFPRDVTDCFWSATLGGSLVLGNVIPLLGQMSISAAQGNNGLNLDADEVAVVVYEADTGDESAAPFTVTVTCP